MLLQQLQLSEPGTAQVMAVGSAAREGQESVRGGGEGVKSSAIQNAEFAMCTQRTSELAEEDKIGLGLF